MTFHFGQLISHVCKTRNVRAGSIVGSGTVSNKGTQEHGRKTWPKGYSCIAEKRAIETILDGQPSTDFMKFGDTIRIDAGQVLRCDFTERIIEEERNIIRSLEVRDLVCRFRSGDTALDSLNFALERGEMVCVMGASGCGKSTLLRLIAGLEKRTGGELVLDGSAVQGLRSATRVMLPCSRDR